MRVSFYLNSEVIGPDATQMLASIADALSVAGLPGPTFVYISGGKVIEGPSMGLVTYAAASLLPYSALFSGMVKQTADGHELQEALDYDEKIMLARQHNVPLVLVSDDLELGNNEYYLGDYTKGDPFVIPTDTGLRDVHGLACQLALAARYRGIEIGREVKKYTPEQVQARSLQRLAAVQGLVPSGPARKIKETYNINVEGKGISKDVLRERFPNMWENELAAIDAASKLDRGTLLGQLTSKIGAYLRAQKKTEGVTGSGASAAKKLRSAGANAGFLFGAAPGSYVSRNLIEREVADGLMDEIAAWMEEDSEVKTLPIDDPRRMVSDDVASTIWGVVRKYFTPSKDGGYLDNIATAAISTHKGGGGGKGGQPSYVGLPKFAKPKRTPVQMRRALEEGEEQAGIGEGVARALSEAELAQALENL
jgi:hypothetical protein